MPSQGLYERFVNFYTDFAFSKYDTAERLAYQDSLKDYRDYYNTIYTAKEEGRTEGFDDGMQKGLQKGRAEGIAEAEAKAHGEKIEMAAG